MATIYTNQAGYLTNGIKTFITNAFDLEFEIFSIATNTCVYRGTISEKARFDEASGLVGSAADFSDFKAPGTYYIKIGVVDSYPFEISDTVFNDVTKKSLKSFYYQRCGSHLGKAYAGIHGHDACHMGPNRYHESAEFSGSKDVSGAWHDAGDYGRYIIPAAVSIGLMMMGYERFPEKLSFDNLEIPESGNNVPDFLDEMKYELEWMLKMQHLKEGDFYGGVHYMVNSRNYTWDLPEKDVDEQFIYGISSRATGAFAAIMAMAARNFKKYDPEFAAVLLDAAVHAWDFLERKGRYPEGGFQRPDDTKTGGYATVARDNQNDTPDKMWAAVELWLTTGEEHYHELASSLLSNPDNLQGGLNWMDTSGFAEIQYCLTNKEDADNLLSASLKNRIKLECDRLLELSNNNLFGPCLLNTDYKWGSNGEVLTRALVLIIGSIEFDSAEYKTAALKQLNYILGLNCHNLSFVTGVGTDAVKNIHHAALATDRDKGAFPGLLAGGPNNEISADPILSRFFTANTPPAKCYKDHVDSYSSNENCILYNAPLIPVSAFFSNI